MRDMQEDEVGAGDELDRDLDVVGVREVSESFYAGRPAVIVRTTHLQGSDEEGHVRRGLRRLAREGRTVGLKG
jgi:isocitrate/isopropylmalate dehydrogenase